MLQHGQLGRDVSCCRSLSFKDSFPCVAFSCRRSAAWGLRAWGGSQNGSFIRENHIKTIRNDL